MKELLVERYSKVFYKKPSEKFLDFWANGM